MKGSDCVSSDTCSVFLTLAFRLDPFFELSRRIDSAGGASWDNVFRSTVVKDDLSPQWQESTIELSLLCGGDLDTPVLLTVYDHESDGKHKAMGKVETSVNGLVSAGSNHSKLTLVGGRKGKEAGTISVQKADAAGVESITEGVQKLAVYTPSLPGAMNAVGQPSFVDYVSGGCNLNVCVAIDFTGSNGKLPMVYNTRARLLLAMNCFYTVLYCTQQATRESRAHFIIFTRTEARMIMKKQSHPL